MGIVERQIQPLVSAFRLPRYDELPKMGLYLDQVVQYINGYFPEAMGIKMTNTMVSSYVKHGLLNHPRHRQYDRDQLASLFLITISRQVLSLHEIQTLLHFRGGQQSVEDGYNYLCAAFELALRQAFSAGVQVEKITVPDSEEKRLLDRLVQMISCRVYLRMYLDQVQENHGS
ncbi:DUF1836 domain-containing protein [Limosilactobacillus avium]|uniref:DUF1836 domain-containing protein n=1 Tax=Limosilactobacillus avium TaxID=2991831 RepID=UPI0024BA645E|nr:DUF1836 domain-containing protein [Limosilactobacillus avium]